MLSNAIKFLKNIIDNPGSLQNRTNWDSPVAFSDPYFSFIYGSGLDTAYVLQTDTQKPIEIFYNFHVSKDRFVVFRGGVRIKRLLTLEDIVALYEADDDEVPSVIALSTILHTYSDYYCTTRLSEKGGMVYCKEKTYFFKDYPTATAFYKELKDNGFEVSIFEFPNHFFDVEYPITDF